MPNDKKLVTIYVNATPHEWPKESITYAEVVTLGFPDFPQHPEITYSVKYRKAHGHQSDIMVPGETVKIKEGMIFDVSRTGQS